MVYGVVWNDILSSLTSNCKGFCGSVAWFSKCRATANSINMIIWLQKILMRCIFAVPLKKVDENGG